MTCKRAICECDRAFAEAHALVAEQVCQFGIKNLYFVILVQPGLSHVLLHDRLEPRRAVCYPRTEFDAPGKPTGIF